MNMWNLADVFRYMIILNYSIHPSETAKNISNIKETNKCIATDHISGSC